MSCRRSLAAAMLVCVPLLTMVSCEQQSKTGRMDPARFHAEMLVAGDFRTSGDLVPYHLERLVQLGRVPSGPVLLEMLENSSPTPIHCIGESVFYRTHPQALKPGDEPERVRKATIADLANWALLVLCRR